MDSTFGTAARLSRPRRMRFAFAPVPHGQGFT
jgi:hypothetical protein